MNEMHAENKADHHEIKDMLRALNGRVRRNEVEIARVRERQNLMALAVSGLSLVASAVATWLGMRT